MSTQAEIKAEIRSKIQEQSIDMLMTSLMLLKDDFRVESDIIFVYILSELEDRMPEHDYIALCDLIYS